MAKNNDFQTVEIFSGLDWQAAMVKNLLENEGIQCFIKDEILGTIAPWYTGNPGPGSVTVVISSLDMAKAKPIIEDYEKNNKTNDRALKKPM
jgi:hypothetical protein